MRSWKNARRASTNSPAGPKSPIMDFLSPRAHATPHRAALIWGKRALTYRQLDAWVAALAQRLTREGVTAGTRVAALLPKEPAAVAAIHAVARLGAVLVPLNLRLTTDEMSAQIAHSQATHILTTQTAAKQARAVAGERAVIEIANEEAIALEGNTGKETNAAIPHSQFAIPHAPFAILFTSGTTGHAKAAVLTTANFYWSAVASAFRLGVLPDDRWLLTLPLYHVGGLSILLRSALYGTAVVLPESNTPLDSKWLYEVLIRQRVTLVSLVPTQLHRLLHAVKTPPPRHLRTVLLGGAAAPADLLHEALARGYPVALTYGLTEAASQVATAAPADVRRNPGSAGRPLLYTRVRVVDEAGQDFPPHAIGEIIVSGPTVFAGYDRDTAATRAALRDGWLHTHDMGYLDDEGNLWVVNRRDDLIVTGGENVYPAEVEAVLRQHPAVANACVVGLDDAEWGQRVAAAVVLRSNAHTTPAALEAFCRQHLAGYKVPRLIRLMPDFPRTASGKVQRARVKALLQRD